MHLTYEKVWDSASARMFYFNHQLKTSTWDRPHLLWRYGDVTTPTPWIPVDVAVPQPAAADGSEQQQQMYQLHYWHVTAQRDLPRKPDGLILCIQCQRNIAIHRCLVCEVDYCIPCHRDTHKAPLNFAQKTLPTEKELENPGKLGRI